MMRFLMRLCCLSLGFAATAHATPKSAIGGGVGFPGFLHLDYHHWIKPKTSIEFGLTPLLMLNIGVLGLTQHIPLAPEADNDHNLVVSATATTLVGIMDGSPAFGLGGRVGYEWLSTKFGASVAAGPTLLQTTGGPCELQPFFDFRVTLWNVKR